MSRYRYTVECGSPDGKLIWWHDDDQCYETMPIAADFVSRMRERYGSQVVVHHVSREQLGKLSMPPPVSEPEKRIFVFGQAEVHLDLPEPARRLLPSR